MAVRINDTAPNFKAQTTQGPIDFHEWIGDKWAILFSHPKDFTPVCTTELGYMAKIEPEFTKRNAKLIGLSVDPVDSHSRWLADIEETQGAKVNYPIIGDSDLAVSKLYDMLPAEEPGTSEGRTPATNQTVRTVFVVGPDKKIKLMLSYPMTTGRNFDEILRVLELDAIDGEAQGLHTRELETRGRRHHLRLGQRRRSQETVPGGMADAEALYPHRQAAGLNVRALAKPRVGTAPSPRVDFLGDMPFLVWRPCGLRRSGGRRTKWDNSAQTIFSLRPLQKPEYPPFSLVGQKAKARRGALGDEARARRGARARGPMPPMPLASCERRARLSP